MKGHEEATSPTSYLTGITERHGETSSHGGRKVPTSYMRYLHCTRKSNSNLVQTFHYHARSLVDAYCQEKSFEERKRSTDELVECVKTSVRLKLLSCKLKKSSDGERMAKLWDLPEAIFI
ncbi:hypothetical protein Tco_1545896 [Tanacetum coccineum]